MAPGKIPYHPLPTFIKPIAQLGRLLGWCFSAIPTRERAIAELQLRKIMPYLSTRRTVRSLYGNLGASILESILLALFRPVKGTGRHSESTSSLPKSSLPSFPTSSFPSFPPSTSSDITADQWQTLYRLLNAPSGRGILCLTGHVGNWDLLGARIAGSGIPLTVIGREARNPLFHRLLVWLRGRAGLNTIWRNEKGALKSLVRALSSPGIVAALIDQDTHVDSIMSPFFGVPVKTPSALIELALRLDCHIFSAFYPRQGYGSFKFEIRELYDPAAKSELGPSRTEAPTAESTAELIARAYHVHLEEIICRYPDQWVWMHKRWRTLVATATMPLSENRATENLSYENRNNGNRPGKTLSSTEYLQYLASEDFKPRKLSG